MAMCRNTSRLPLSTGSSPDQGTAAGRIIVGGSGNVPGISPLGEAKSGEQPLN